MIREWWTFDPGHPLENGLRYFQSLISGHGSRVVKVVIVEGFATSSSPVPLKTRRVGQRCTSNMSRAETASRWCDVVVRRGGASSGLIHIT
ncbi:hypothetical protein TNCV_2787581 [Trichonephila clavipes]|uniref:Uncharacterized protein n=1 Tax=Trichonephila clavipes TaxID=2585209 RepID=A0A8X6SWF8_TRICX|nr:hypothetical protein TNCV_2787581 [Trichonephila clavipes]